MQQLAEIKFALGERGQEVLGRDKSLRHSVSQGGSDSSGQSLRNCFVGAAGKGSIRISEGAGREAVCLRRFFWPTPVSGPQRPLLETWSALFLLLKDSPKEEMDREIAMDLIKDTDPSGKKCSSPWTRGRAPKVSLVLAFAVLEAESAPSLSWFYVSVETLNHRGPEIKAYTLPYKCAHI